MGVRARTVEAEAGAEKRGEEFTAAFIRYIKMLDDAGLSLENIDKGIARFHELVFPGSEEEADLVAKEKADAKAARSLEKLSVLSINAWVQFREDEDAVAKTLATMSKPGTGKT